MESRCWEFVLECRCLLIQVTRAELPGLGWIPGTVKDSPRDQLTRFACHIWGGTIISVSRDTDLLQSLNGDAWFYFLHSYYFVCSQSADELASCDYGFRFSCAVNRTNIFGVQFHPEKSHDYGARLLRNFSEI